MSQEYEHEHASPDHELTAIEAALGSLVPARSRIDRDLVMFRAGQAAAGSRNTGRNAWIAIAASLALVALGEGAFLARRQPPQVVERIVVVRAPAATPVPDQPAEPESSSIAMSPPADRFGLGRTAHERQAWQVLRYGLDGLPAPATARAESSPQAAPSRQSLREILNKELDLGDPS